MPDTDQTRQLEIADDNGVLLRRHTVWDIAEDERRIVAMQRAMQDDAQYGDLDDATKEALLDALASSLDQLQGEREQKIEAALRIYRERQLDLAAQEAIVKGINEAAGKARSGRSAVEADLARLKEWFARVLDDMGETKHKGAAGTVFFQTRKPKVAVAWQDGLTQDDKEVFFRGIGEDLSTASVTITGCAPRDMDKILQFCATRGLAAIMDVQLSVPEITSYAERCSTNGAGFDKSEAGQYVTVTAEESRSVVVR